MPQFPEITERFPQLHRAAENLLCRDSGNRGGKSEYRPPRGSHTLRVLGPHRIVWLNLTGGENESAAHLRETTRMTLMCGVCSTAAPSFCVLTATPRSSILAIRPGTHWHRCSPTSPAPGKFSM